VETSTVVPSPARVKISSQKARRLSGSTPAVGSSRNRISGRWMVAAASARRWRQPPERCSAAFDAVEAEHLGHEIEVLVDRQVLVEREALGHVAHALA